MSIAISRAATHILIGALAIIAMLYGGLSLCKPDSRVAFKNLIHKSGIAFFIGGCAMSLFASGDIMVSLKKIGILLYYFMPLLFVEIFVYSKNQLERLCNMIAASVIVGGAYAIFQGLQGVKRAKGFVGIMDLGGVLGMVVPMVGILAWRAYQNEERKMTVLYTVAFVIGVGALLANGTRINWIGTFCAFLWFIWKYFKHFSIKQGLIIGSTLIFGIFMVALMDNYLVERFFHIFTISEDPSNYKRVDMWGYGLGVFWQHPWFGIGYGVLPALVFNEFHHMADVSGNGDYGHVHSTYIQLLAETGVVGFVSYFIFLFCYILKPYFSYCLQNRTYWDSILIVILISFSVNGLTDYTLGIGPIVYAFLVTTGICLKGMKLEMEKSAN